MPSLWKKKGNRISRLVADLQTTPKRGGSLVVETGFPTSLVDLFVKNRDKLKKSKSKKPKSKKHAKITEDDDVVDYDDNDADDDKSIPKVPSVSNSSESLSDLEVPRCSIVGKCQKRDSFVDDDNVTHENPVVELHHESCKNDTSINEEKRQILEVSNAKNMVLFSTLMGLLVLIVVLYTKRWFLAFVTLGFLLLLLLEYVGNPIVKLFKPCENVVSMSVLKGGLAVVVALYTKWFVVGITMGASLLLLLEYAGNSGFGWFKPCNDATWTLQGFLSQWGAIRRDRKFGERDERRRGRGFLKRSANIGSRKEAPKKGKNDVVSRGDFGQGGVGDGVASRKEKEIEAEFGNNLPSKRGIDEPSIEDGDVIASNGVIEQGIRCSSYVNDSCWLLEEDSRNKPMYELLALESNGSKKSESSYVSDPVRYIDLQGEKGAIEGGEEGNEDTKTVKHKEKGNKGKKFWKKFVPKKKNKKNEHKHEKAYDVANTDGSIHDTEAELEEEDEVEEGEQEISEGEGTSTLSSYEQDEVGSDNVGASDSSCTEMLEIDNSTTSSCGMIKEQCGNPKYLAIMMIPLTGLIGGRMFAVALTVICCLVFKVVRG